MMSFEEFEFCYDQANRELADDIDCMKEKVERMGAHRRVLDAARDAFLKYNDLIEQVESRQTEIDELNEQLEQKDTVIANMRQQLLEVKEQRLASETKLSELSKLTAGVAKKSSQDDMIKAMRSYLNISKRKTLSKREAAKTVLLELITAAKLEMSEDIMEMLSHFDDEELTDQPQSPGSVNENVAELLTVEAQVLWQRLRDAGFIVADGYALAEGVSANQAAYIADRMAEKLRIKKKWKLFQQLWGIPNLGQLAGTWQQTGKLPPRSGDIDKLMK